MVSRCLDARPKAGELIDNSVRFTTMWMVAHRNECNGYQFLDPIANGRCPVAGTGGSVRTAQTEPNHDRAAIRKSELGSHERTTSNWDEPCMW